ncbi:hypothetical protein AGLY_013393, partial [Aphis glycines]
ITCRNNASISNFVGGFRWQSEYPWCILYKSKIFDIVVTQKLITCPKNLKIPHKLVLIAHFFLLAFEVHTWTKIHQNHEYLKYFVVKIYKKFCLSVSQLKKNYLKFKVLRNPKLTRRSVCHFLFLQVGGKDKKLGNYWYTMIVIKFAMNEIEIVNVNVMTRNLCYKNSVDIRIERVNAEHFCKDFFKKKLSLTYTVPRSKNRKFRMYYFGTIGVHRKYAFYGTFLETVVFRSMSTFVVYGMIRYWTRNQQLRGNKKEHLSTDFKHLLQTSVDRNTFIRLLDGPTHPSRLRQLQQWSPQSGWQHCQRRNNPHRVYFCCSSLLNDGRRHSLIPRRPTAGSGSQYSAVLQSGSDAVARIIHYYYNDNNSLIYANIRQLASKTVRRGGGDDDVTRRRTVACTH